MVDISAKIVNDEMESLFSIDVEDWFHILDLPSTPQISKWETLPSIVEKTFSQLLELLSANNVKATFFFLGWIAERYPHLVREALQQGHELASHGYSHELVYRMTREEFLQDALLSKNIIENIAGEEVRGYRSAGFSVTQNTPWFFESLIEAGYSYDTSVFPAKRQHGGLMGADYRPFVVKCSSGKIVEFPISVANLWGLPVCFFGGGYLRFFPYSLIRRMGKRVLAERRPIVFYVHPRDIDANQPRLKMGLKRRFKTYVGLASAKGKLNKILEEFTFLTFSEYMNKYTSTEVSHVGK